MKKILKWLVYRIVNSEPFRSQVASPACVSSIVSSTVSKIIQTNMLAAKWNSLAFSEYKGSFKGRDVVLFATGPSLLKYKEINGCVKVGVNHAFLKVNDLDILFTGDYHSVGPVWDKFQSYRGNSCKKFIGWSWEHVYSWDSVVPERFFDGDTKRFVLDYSLSALRPDYFYPCDISVQPILGAGSIALTATEFILWTHPRRIYLVGCDCSSAGHFMSEDLMVKVNPDDYCTRLVEPWKKMKEFASRFYPDIEIISVNPVGLKGVFPELNQGD